MNKYIKCLIAAIVVIAILSIGIIASNANKNKYSDDGKFKIVTSFYPMYIITQNLAKDVANVEVVNMADVNVGCIHDYTLTTNDMKKIESADVFVRNGLGLEMFLDKVLFTNEDVYILDSSANIENLIKNNEEVNPHIWTGLDNYINQIKNIQEGLEKQNPENAQLYRKNAEKYISEIENLKTRYMTELKGLEGKGAIALNESFAYLGRDLKLELTTIKTDHDKETISAENLKNIINKMKNENIKIIFIDINDNSKNAETIANETGGKIYRLNSGLTGPVDENAYIDLMNENLNVLKTIE